MLWLSEKRDAPWKTLTSEPLCSNTRRRRRHHNRDREFLCRVGQPFFPSFAHAREQVAGDSVIASGVAERLEHALRNALEDSLRLGDATDLAPEGRQLIGRRVSFCLVASGKQLERQSVVLKGRSAIVAGVLIDRRRHDVKHRSEPDFCGRTIEQPEILEVGIPIANHRRERHLFEEAVQVFLGQLQLPQEFSNPLIAALVFPVGERIAHAQAGQRSNVFKAQPLNAARGVFQHIEAIQNQELAIVRKRKLRRENVRVPGCRQAKELVGRKPRVVCAGRLDDERRVSEWPPAPGP